MEGRKIKEKERIMPSLVDTLRSLQHLESSELFCLELSYLKLSDLKLSSLELSRPESSRLELS